MGKGGKMLFRIALLVFVLLLAAGCGEVRDVWHLGALEGCNGHAHSGLQDQ